ncbi:MAG TPA: CocE/NonD family hydrolase [Thermoleophilaceae bacterium]
MRRGLALSGVGLALAFFAAPAFAGTAPFGRVCAAQDGVRFCGGTMATRVASFDGVPLDADVTLPPSGNGPFPTIVMLHGWGGSKTDFEATSAAGNGNTTYHYNNVYFAQRGYAVLNYTARGWGNSCGSSSSRLADPVGCAQGWIHLADQRYEAHDTQYLLGLLADEGVTTPNEIGVTGISYGGGQSIELALLRNRVRQVPAQGSGYVPWTSPKGTPMTIAAAYPRWPWSDLVESLEPNGRFLDFNVPSTTDSRVPLGVAKQSYVEGLYTLGLTNGFYSAPGTDPNADVTTWNTRITAGEPETPDDDAIATQIFDFHQGFGITGATPAPLLLQSGWTDDLFPPEESLRIYNWLRASNPSAQVSLQFGDLGHARGTNVPAVDKAFQDSGSDFFDHYLKGAGSAPAPGSVSAYAQVCPVGSPVSGPFNAPSWPQLHPGAVLFGSNAAQTITSDGGDQNTAATYDPIAGGTLGGTTSCTQVPAEQASGTAVYNGPVSKGFTLLGLPTVSAHLAVSGQFGQLDSRLWDVGPDGKQTLISRGIYRLTDNESGNVVFQLHGNGWRFAPGHKPKLELLGRDADYARPSNGSFQVQVTNLRVELPTLDKPGAAGGQVVGPGANRIKLSVRPRRPHAGRRVKLIFYAKITPAGHRLPVRGAKIRFAGKTFKTNKHGRVTVHMKFRRAGKRRASATRSGLLKGTTTVRVLRHR